MCRSVLLVTSLDVRAELCEHEREDKLVHGECHVLGSVHASLGIPRTKKSTAKGKLVVA